MSKFTKEQKESIGLLSTGTFLEYFDLLLYVHMAVLLNELFFPQTDAHASRLLAAFAFCSTFVARPFGALLFGWIGDHMGRKTTIIITSMMMALSCLVMANLPTYEQIGITASWIITICRIIQGMSSMGEIIGADIYLMETIKAPGSYPAVAFLQCFMYLGGFAALTMAMLVTSYGLNWRMAFLAGSIVAIIGVVARTRLRETAAFSNDVKNLLSKRNPEINHSENFALSKKVNKKTFFALFLMDCAFPVVFYIVYIHCGSILKDVFYYTPEQIIHHNFMVSLIEISGAFFIFYLSSRVCPLLILKVKLAIFSVFIMAFPYLMNSTKTPFDILLIQGFMVLFGYCINPAFPVIYKHFAVYKRFTATTLSCALTRILIYGTTAFGAVYLTKYWGHAGIVVIMVPVGIGFTWGLFYFQKLEKENKNINYLADLIIPDKKIF